MPIFKHGVKLNTLGGPKKVKDGGAALPLGAIVGSVSGWTTSYNWNVAAGLPVILNEKAGTSNWTARRRATARTAPTFTA